MRVAALRPCLVTVILVMLPLAAVPAMGQGIEDSYHAQLGRGTGTGMLEKWCALQNFSLEQQGCNDCHIGADWNPEKSFPDCFLCHNGEGFAVTDSGCMNCHDNDTARRGDLFTPEKDVHIAAGLDCVDCHLRYEDRRSGQGRSYNDFLKSSIRCRGSIARRPRSGSTNTSLSPLSKTWASDSSSFIAIHGQLAQL